MPQALTQLQRGGHPPLLKRPVQQLTLIIEPVLPLLVLTPIIRQHVQVIIHCSHTESQNLLQLLEPYLLLFSQDIHYFSARWVPEQSVIPRLFVQRKDTEQS